MDADADHGGHEGVVLLSMDHHAVQAVIIEDPVVDPFRCGTLVVDFLVGIRAARDFRVKPDIPFRPGLDDPSIFGRGAAVPAFGAMLFPVRAPPHEVSAGLIIAIGNHTPFFLADGCPILVNGYGIRDCFGPPAFIVQVNKRPDSPGFQEAVSGIVVHSGVKAHIFCTDCRHVLFHFMESGKETDGIVPFGTGKAQDEWDVCFEFRVIAGELEKGIAEVILFQIAVPSPGSIGVREMPHVLRCAVPVVAAWAGMGMDSSAVAGNSEVFLWDEVALYGREDGGIAGYSYLKMGCA